MARARGVIGLLSVWVAVGLAFAFFQSREENGFIVIYLWVLYWAVGAGVFVLAGVLTRRITRRPGVLMASGAAIVLVSVVMYLLAMPALFAAGDRFFFNRHFSQARPAYERIALEVTNGGQSPTARRDDIFYIVDPGPPVRVAFQRPGSILDNWEAVVYDPSGRVATATGFDPEGRFTAAADVLKIFDGDLVACRPLGGAFYRCWFT